MTRNGALALRVVETLLIAVGGFLVISGLAHGSGMPKQELMVGPLALAFMWLGFARPGSNLPKSS